MKKNKAGKNWEHPIRKPSRKEIDATLEYFKHLANKEDNQEW